MHTRSRNPPLRCVLWERNVEHSIRPGFADGFLFPYQRRWPSPSARESIPRNSWPSLLTSTVDAYSFGSELLTHDGAVASLVACAATLHRIRGQIEGPWDQALA